MSEEGHERPQEGGQADRRANHGISLARGVLAKELDLVNINLQ